MLSTVSPVSDGILAAMVSEMVLSSIPLTSVSAITGVSAIGVTVTPSTPVTALPSVEVAITFRSNVPW